MVSHHPWNKIQNLYKRFKGHPWFEFCFSILFLLNMPNTNVVIEFFQVLIPFSLCISMYTLFRLFSTGKLKFPLIQTFFLSNISRIYSLTLITPVIDQWLSFLAYYEDRNDYSLAHIYRMYKMHLIVVEFYWTEKCLF